MALRNLFSTIWLSCLLAACGGGNETAPTDSPSPQTRLLATVQSTVVPLVFDGFRANYTISPTASGFAVTNNVSGGTTNVAKNARLRFADHSVALDAEKNGGQMYRLYQAAFNRVPDAAGLGYWIDVADKGAALNDIAAGFINSAEFRSIYGVSANSADVVKAYYLNALHRTGDAQGIAYWVGVLEKAQVTQPDMLVFFSESTENQLAVISTIQNGITYLEPGVAYAPQANAGATVNLMPGAIAMLDGSASTGTSGKPLSYSWTLLSRPAGSSAALVQSGTARPSLIADMPGAYQAELIVNDGRDSAPARVYIVALWKAPAAVVPATGNYVYLQSDSGDYIGGGRSYLYTGRDATLSVSPSGGLLNVRVAGDQDWDAQFQAMNTLTRLQPGYYSDLTRYPFHNPVKGGLNWSGEGRGCNTLSGWFYIDKITYVGQTVTAVDLRFEQHCEGGNAALRGQIHWTVNDTASIPGPQNPPPANLWQPAAGTTPVTGNYIYLSSTSGDFIGGGRTYLYTQTNAILKVSNSGATLNAGVNGNQYWHGEFAGMKTLARLEPGYYGDLTRYPFHNAVKGGLSWGGDGRGCNTLTGWFVVDSVVYEGLTLKAVDLRFEQHCEGGSSALRGKIHWNASDTSTPVGPIAG